MKNTTIENIKLKNQIRELADAVNFLKVREESYLRLLFKTIQKLGGSFEISDEGYAVVEGRLIATVDKEKKTTIFSIEQAKEA